MEAAGFSGTHVSALVTPRLKNFKMRKARGKEKVAKTVKWDDIKSKPLVNLKISQKADSIVLLSICHMCIIGREMKLIML